MIFIIKGFHTTVFIFIIISTTLRPICPPAFFREPSRNFELRPLLKLVLIFIRHNRVQVLRIPILLLACSQDWTCNLQMIVSLEA